jgi:hypothetical protein
LAIAFALAACDDDEVAPPPAVPPGTVTDLAVDSVSAATITLTWTAPGDDGDEGRASSYRLKHSGSPIDGSNFASATAVASVPPPAPAGTIERFTVTGLDSTLTYYFAIRAGDADGLNSGVSNNAVWQPPAAPDTLRISGVSANVVSPGDVIVIRGSNFPPPAQNQVLFTNPLAVTTAFAGSVDSIEVVVNRDATSGPITVTTAYYSAQTPFVEVRRGVGDFFVFGGLGPGQALSLPNPAASTRYLVIPHATNPSAPYMTDFGYSIESESVSPLMADAFATGSSRGLSPTTQSALGVREAFEAWRWAESGQLVKRVGIPTRVRNRRTAQTAPPYQQFYVLNTPTGSVLDPGNYTQVTADLRYTGTKCLVYADVDTLADPADNFDTAHFRELGQSFDNSIEATNVNYFGAYSDIDDNDKVILLITPVVNRLTPPNSGGFIAGFFLAIDLYSPPQVPAGTTNEAEILYLLAADPNEVWGNPFPVDFTAAENIGTTAHELEHLISFSHRIFQQGGATQATWLEEGMAHMAEDLNGLHDSNMRRADLYLQSPGSISLEDLRATLSQRGGIYLFLRLMSDRYGTGILKNIVQSSCIGRSCIESATGEDFYQLVAEFLAALYLEGKGITTDSRFDFTSINLADYGVVATIPGLVGVESAGDVRRSSGDLYLYNGVMDSDTRFTFNELFAGPQLRHAIVRIE